jgi:hypothetical protein
LSFVLPKTRRGIAIRVNRRCAGSSRSYPKLGASSSLGLFEAVDPDTNDVLKSFQPRAVGRPDTTCYGITPNTLRSNKKKQ